MREGASSVFGALPLRDTFSFAGATVRKYWARAESSEVRLCGRQRAMEERILSSLITTLNCLLCTVTRLRVSRTATRAHLAQQAATPTETGLWTLQDYADFAACIAGPGTGLGPGCECFDFDNDSDIDFIDFAEFQKNFTGS